MENIKVNSNKYIAFKNAIKKITFGMCVVTFILLFSLSALILISQHLIRYEFFADSLLYQDSHLLNGYQNEIEEHNLPVFYDMASQLLQDKQDYNSLVIYKVLNNHTVQKFNLNDFPLSLKILKRHKEFGINNSVYLVDLTYVHKENNEYKIKHDNVILKTNDIYYLENEYSYLLYCNYMAKGYHYTYLNREKKDSKITDSMKKNAIKSLNELDTVVSQK